MSNISEHIQLQATDSLVQLFELDCSSLGGSIYYFTPSVNNNLTNIQFGGQTWSAIPIKIEGLEYNGAEAPAKPTVTISNVGLQLLGPVIALRDLVGAKLTRYRTFERFLANGQSPDSQALLPKDVYFLAKKVVHNNMNIQWELASSIDRPGLKLPRRLFLKRDFPGVAGVRLRA